MTLHIDDEPAWILQHKPWRESSLWLTIFTQQQGRLNVLAKGARRPKSPWRGLLQPFTPLRLSCRGRTDLLTLTAAEKDHDRPAPKLQGKGVWLGYYLNELLLRFLYPYDTSPTLFQLYQQQLTALANAKNAADIENSLRFFEKHLLDESGYGLSLTPAMDVAKTTQKYTYYPGKGIFPYVSDNMPGIHIQGSCLQSLQQGKPLSQECLPAAKQLLRRELARHLGHKPLKSRLLFQKFQQPTL
jgi:DNA repair protein RecO (recombination protein O)